MELEFYKCNYCFKEYRPTRRGAQKYCSDSCRVNSHRLRNKNNKLAGKNKNEKVALVIPETKKETMSLGGVGNAAVGSLLAEGIKSAFTPDNSKAATKADIYNLIEKLNSRYLLINNMQPDSFVRHPYYDLVSGNVIYLKSS